MQAHYAIPAIQIPADVADEYCAEVDDDERCRSPTILLDAYSCDEFRMYEFKIRRCFHGRPHDWTDCPYAHPGEKARRRDPRKYNYSGTACPDYRKGSCCRGDGCDFAHGVFECWLHPARYRTQPCKDGVGCRRKVCFFAHTSEQLRVLPLCKIGGGNGTDQGGVESYDGSPTRRKRSREKKRVVLSPTSTLLGQYNGYPLSSTGSESFGSPPVSPTVEEVIMGMRKMGIRGFPASEIAGSSLVRQIAAVEFEKLSNNYNNSYNINTTTNSCNNIIPPWFGDGMMMKEEEEVKKSRSKNTIDEPDWFSDLMN